MPVLQTAKLPTSWNFIVQFITKVNDREEYDPSEWYDHLGHTILSLASSLDSDCYFHEIVSDWGDQDFKGGLSEGYDKLPPGLYRFTFGVKCFSSQSYEGDYDAWQTYDLIDYYRFNTDEANEMIMRYVEDDPTAHEEDPNRFKMFDYPGEVVQ